MNKFSFSHYISLTCSFTYIDYFSDSFSLVSNEYIELINFKHVKNLFRFSNGVEYANMAVCSDLPLKALDAISRLPTDSMDTDDDPTSAHLLSVAYGISQVSSTGPVIIAFGNSSPPNISHLIKNHLEREEGRSFIEAENTREFGFLRTKENPAPRINKTAVDCFDSLLLDLSDLKINKIYVKVPLIITGHSLGGSVASLFTLWLLDSIYSEAKERPICITFGSPLLGDQAFQGAILERPTWLSCFLHFISNHDPIPKTFVTPNTSPNYMPFGRTIFLSDRGCSSFEESKSALKVIETVSSRCPSSDIVNYGEILQELRNMAISGENEEEGECESDSSTLREGIILQIQAATEESSDMKPLVTYIEERTEELFKQRRNAWEFDHPKMLNEMKIFMANVEWYKKCTIKLGGYYDHYKTGNEMEIKARIGRYRDTLTVYWEKKTTEIEKMPKREGENAIRSRYRYGGMNYRRMFEPLDIADHYRQGKREYQKEGIRSQHFKLLEQWAKNDKPKKRKKASSMTEDSCFWARVEEAALSCKDLNDGKISLEDATRDLDEFEKYVMGLIQSYAVSPEIFLKGSSFIRWWKAYMQIKGDAYESELKSFMKKEKLEDGSNFLKEYSNLP